MFEPLSAIGLKAIDMTSGNWEQFKTNVALALNTQPDYEAEADYGLDSLAWTAGTYGNYQIAMAPPSATYQVCYVLPYTNVYFLTEESLAYLQNAVDGEFPPVIDPSDVVGASAEPSGEETGGNEPNTMGNASFPWWVLLLLVLFIWRKRK